MVASPHSAAPRPSASPEGLRIRAGVELELAGDLRYLSHHDEMRMLARTFVRAHWPIAYSQGFNPIPRMTLPLPRSVGMASTCDLVIVELTEERPVDDLRVQLAAALPRGCRILRLWPALPRGTPHARQVTYEIGLDTPLPEGLAERIEQLLAATTLPVTRAARPGKPARQLDIRPYLQRVELEGAVLRLSLRVEQQQTARPAELLTLLDLAPQSCMHRLVRRAVEWDMDFDEPVRRLAPQERNNLGTDIEDQEEDEEHT